MWWWNQLNIFHHPPHLLLWLTANGWVGVMFEFTHVDRGCVSEVGAFGIDALVAVVGLWVDV